MSRLNKILISIIAVFFLLLLIGTIWGFLSFRVVNWKTGSMANTIISGDRILCKIGVGEIKRGEIVLFKLPADPKVFYLKRVIGLPGETVQFRGMKVLINGQELAEARTIIDLRTVNGPPEGLLPEVSSEGTGKYRVYYEKPGDEIDEELHGMRNGVREPYRISEGHYFVVGDCRDNSLDSRFWGTVPRELIVGKALMILDSSAPGGENRAFTSLQV